MPPLSLPSSSHTLVIIGKLSGGVILVFDSCFSVAFLEGKD